MDAYYIFWTALIVIGVWTGLSTFFWALRRGQFDEQERARFLPLRGENAPTAPEKGGGAVYEKYLLVAMVLLALAGLVAAALTTILTSRGLRL